jgi:hypothetical protein
MKKTIPHANAQTNAIACQSIPALSGFPLTEVPADKEGCPTTNNLLNNNRNGFIPRYEPKAKAFLNNGYPLDQEVFHPFYAGYDRTSKWDGSKLPNVKGPFDGWQFITYTNWNKAINETKELTYFTVPGPTITWRDCVNAVSVYNRLTGDTDHCAVEDVEIVRVDEYEDHFYQLRGSLAPKDYPKLRIAVVHVGVGS